MTCSNLDPNSVIIKPEDIKLILVDPIEELCEAWRSFGAWRSQSRFEGIAAVSVVHGRFEDLPAYDCMVSPANSFGLMDGGVDLAIIAVSN